jgi:hypothetical protein
MQAQVRSCVGVDYPAARKDQGSFMSISTKPQGPIENRLLAALPDEVLVRLLPHLQPVSFALGGVVY